MKQITGFTLIEIIAAMAIVAIGLVSLLALFPTGLGMNQQSAGTTAGMLLCKTMMEDIKKAGASFIDGDPQKPVRISDLQDGNDPAKDEWYQFGGYKEPTATKERQVFPQNSIYEVSVSIDENIPGLGQQDSDDGLVRVVVTAYWPRVTGSGPNVEKAKKKQYSVKLVSYIRCGRSVVSGP
jgi:uncharacterized protein (TIGR02598 family)